MQHCLIDGIRPGMKYLSKIIRRVQNTARLAGPRFAVSAGWLARMDGCGDESTLAVSTSVLTLRFQRRSTLCSLDIGTHNTIRLTFLAVAASTSFWMTSFYIC